MGGGPLLSYFVSCQLPDGVTYSVDKLVLDFKLSAPSGEDWSERFLRFLSLDTGLEFDHWESRKIGTFRHQFTFACLADNSFWVGVGLNSSGKAVNRVRLEFNPNKVGRDLSFLRVFNRLCALASRPPGFVRFDLAVDVPVLRENIFLLKDRRLYEEYRLSESNRTQYLGERNRPGRCKLYNKQQESRLPQPLSRLEITVDGQHASPQDVLAIWPPVLILDDLQLAFSDFSLSDIDRFILRSLLLSPDRLTELKGRHKQKFGRILEQYVRTLALDIHFYEKIIQGLGVFRQALPIV